MRIISPFKDYYDYVAKLYPDEGGLVYKRQPFDRDVTKGIYKELNGIDNLRFAAMFEYESYRISNLIVCGSKYYVLTKWDECVRSMRIVNDIDLYRMGIPKDGKTAGLMQDHTQKDYLIDLSKKLHSPVFMLSLSGYGYNGSRYQGPVRLEEDIPILGDLGFSKFYSPIQAYITINSFIENVLRTNPDTVPPVEVDNKQKILAAGFDLKTSFRNPIK